MSDRQIIAGLAAASAVCLIAGLAGLTWDLLVSLRDDIDRLLDDWDSPHD